MVYRGKCFDNSIFYRTQVYTAQTRVYTTATELSLFWPHGHKNAKRFFPLSRPANFHIRSPFENNQITRYETKIVPFRFRVSTVAVNHGVLVVNIFWNVQNRKKSAFTVRNSSIAFDSPEQRIRTCTILVISNYANKRKKCENRPKMLRVELSVITPCMRVFTVHHRQILWRATLCVDVFSEKKKRAVAERLTDMKHENWLFSKKVKKKIKQISWNFLLFFIFATIPCR